MKFKLLQAMLLLVCSIAASQYPEGDSADVHSPNQEQDDAEQLLEELANDDEAHQTPLEQLSQDIDESEETLQYDVNADQSREDDNDASQTPQGVAEDSYEEAGESEPPFLDNVDQEDQPSVQFPSAEKRRLCTKVYTGLRAGQDFYCNDQISRGVWKIYWWWRNVRSCAKYCAKAGKKGGECREGSGRYYLTTWCKKGEACFCEEAA